MTTNDQSPRAGDGKTLAVPFGMALVPLQATFEMVSAFHEVTDHDQLAHGNCQSRWRAMLAAAPTVAPLTLETAEEARKDRAHAEAYFRQAERLLTANEQTLHAEVQSLRAALRQIDAALQGTLANATDMRDMAQDVDAAQQVARLALAIAAAPATADGSEA